MALFLRPLDAACAGAGAGATFLLELDALGALGLDGTIPNSMPDPDALGLGVVPTSPSCSEKFRKDSRIRDPPEANEL